MTINLRPAATPTPGLLTTGEETINRMTVGFTSGSWSLTQTSGTMKGTQFVARKSETVTQVKVYTSSVAAAATPTLCRIGVYSVAANGDHTIIASTPNDTALFAATFTGYTKSLSVPFAKVAGQRYSLCVLVVSATTMPTLSGHPGGVEMSSAPALVTRLSGQTDLPASITAGSLTASSDLIYGVLLP